MSSFDFLYDEFGVCREDFGSSPLIGDDEQQTKEPETIKEAVNQIITPEFEEIIELDAETGESHVVREQIEDPERPPSTAKVMREMYKDRPNLMKGMLRLYKFIVKDVAKQISERTNEDVLKDMPEVKYDLNLDQIVKDSYKQILNVEIRNKMIFKKVELIRPLVDFAYIYYVHFFDNTAPFHELPRTVLKYRMVADAIHAFGKPLYQEINSIFEQIIENKLITGMRTQRPYNLFTSLKPISIVKKIQLVIKPLLKDLLKHLLRLDYATTTRYDVETSKKIGTLEELKELGMLDDTDTLHDQLPNEVPSMQSRENNL